MSLMNWLKGGRDAADGVAPGDRVELASDLKTERLRRVIIDFPGRSDADLARMIYGRDDAVLVVTAGQRLVADGSATRDPDTGALYVSRR